MTAPRAQHRPPPPPDRLPSPRGGHPSPSTASAAARPAGFARLAGVALLALFGGLSLFGGLALPTTAQAQTTTTFVSNLGQTDATTNVVISPTVPRGQQFETGSNSGGYTLSEIVVNIRNARIGTPAFALYTSTSDDKPDTKVVDLNGESSTAGEQSFTPASATTLSASTKYIIAFYMTSGTANLQTTTSNTIDSGASPEWGITENSVYSTNSGTTFASYGNEVEIAVKGTAAGGGTPSTPTLSVGDASGNEGSAVEFPVTLSEAVTDDVTATWTASFGSNEEDAAAADLESTTGTLTIGGGDTQGTFTVTTAGDSTDEHDETFTVTLSGVSSNAQLATDPTATGTITDDDDPPSLSVADVSTSESFGYVTIPVLMTPTSGKTVTVLIIATAESGDTAESPADFLGGSHVSLTLNPGDDRASTTLITVNDEIVEPDETFTVTLSNATNAVISDTTAKITITNDDTADTTCTLNTGDGDIWCGDVTVGDIGSGAYGFVVISATNVVGDLTDNSGDRTFRFGTAEHDVYRVAVSSFGLSFAVTRRTSDGVQSPGLHDDDRARLHLYVDGHSASFAFSDAAFSGTLGYEWSGASLDWTSTPEVTLRVREATPPDAPTEFTAKVGDTQVTLAWKAAGLDSGVTGHEFRYKTDGDYPETWTAIADSGPDETNEDSFTVIELTNEVAHTFELRAVNTAGGGGAAEAGPVTPTPGICDRTEILHEYIVDALSGVDDCAAVTVADLAGLSRVDVGNYGITSLKSGDFAGLTSLTYLNLGLNSLAMLPEDVFSGLTALTELYLISTALSSLPEDVFSGLTALTRLNLDKNNLSSLDAGVFSELTSLTTLHLGSNSLAMLPEDVFSDLTALTQLDLYDNDLSSLHEDVFSGLTALTDLRLYDNDLSLLPGTVFSDLTALELLYLNDNDLNALPDELFTGLTSLTTLTLGSNSTNPMELTVTVEKVGTNQVRAKVLAGAPFAVDLPVTLVDGTLEGSVTVLGVAAGEVDGASVTVTRTSGTTTAVTVDVDLTTQPTLPTRHTGYIFKKATVNLPATILPAAGASTDATLSGLVVNDGTTDLTLTPTFASGMYTYTASVANTVAEVTVTPTKNDSGATIEYLDESDATLTDANTTDAGHQVAVAEGDTVIKVKVTAEDGNATQTYMVTVKRAAADASTDATLSDLVVNDGNMDLTLTPTFASGKYTYTAMVANTVTEVTVTATKNETNATIEYLDEADATLTDANTTDTGQQVAVAEGDNVVKVKVTAEDGNATQTYMVTVTRAAAASTCTLNTGDLWCGAVTVSRFALGVLQVDGFGSGGGDLSDKDFMYGTNSYTIDLVATQHNEEILFFSLNSALTSGDRAGLAVHVDGSSDTFAFGAATYVVAGGSHQYTWTGTGLSWSGSPTTTVRLREVVTGPAAPTNFMVRPAGDAKVALSWDAPASDSGVTRHEYQFKTDGSYGTWTAIANSAVGGANEASFTVPDLTNEVPHTFQLRVVSGDGDGAAAMAGPVTPTPGICDRTQQVQDAILAELSGVDDCAAVTVADLETITYLDMPRKNVTALKSGDFAGLSALDQLQLRQNSLTELPSDLFSGLTALKILNLSNNALESLHPDVFSGLTAMENLSLGDNASLGTALPATVFSDLTSLQLLSLYRIGLETIPTGLFSGLSELTDIFLDHNRLVTLPAGLFSGLTELTELTLDGNTTDPMPLTVTLEKAEDGQVRAKVLAGAPSDLVLPVSVENGTLAFGATGLRVAKGSVAGAPVSVIRTEETGDVTVDLGTPLPSLPVDHEGYEYVKAASGLPVEVPDALEREPGVEGQFRLAPDTVEDYSDDTEGHLDGHVARVEVFHAGRWGTVCSDGFSKENTFRFVPDLDADGDPTGTFTETEPANEAPALVCQSMGYDTGEYASGYGQSGVPSQTSELEMTSTIRWAAATGRATRCRSGSTT